MRLCVVDPWSAPAPGVKHRPLAVGEENTSRCPEAPAKFFKGREETSSWIVLLASGNNFHLWSSRIYVLFFLKKIMLQHMVCRW